MKLLWLTIAALTAFAANSVLTRLAIVGGSDPFAFTLVRLAAGAVMLLVLTRMRGVMPALRLKTRLMPATMLALYMLGFSIAYLALPSGAGALVLFGTVQITMFGGACLGKDVIPPLRWLGALVALGGLSYLLWPSDDVALPFAACLAMMAAGFGWGVYSLLGRGAKNPLADTAYNFALALVPAIFAWFIVQDDITAGGVLLGIIAGAITSGVGYAIWYAVLPGFGASRASVAQLSVPILATVGGVIWLAEPVTLKLMISSALVLGGVGISLVKR
ncbi:DMT family transporter [Pacificibacter marinus]|uniref:DMT family transporter n=1 Tax=Pacificibacter marinus TaxID=658057 RepID=UPI001C07B676|nr:DMT family transporter [Pacificibacter marinus]MBU2868243.1 DMT family transporter [Pacificibacter marinus]